MEDKENKLPSCLIKGPGPKYKLRSLVGFEGHCQSRVRNPAYSIRLRTSYSVPPIGPGPSHNVAKLTNYGVENTPAFSIVGREAFKILSLGPGPGAHSPEKCPPMNHYTRAPAYSIKARGPSRFIRDGPGPNAYSLPSCIGPHIPDKTAYGAYTIAGNHGLRKEELGPGPAAYVNMDHNLIKRRNPAYSLKWRHKPLEKDYVPGPQYYSSYNTARRAPKYSFGIKHSMCAGTPITPLDEQL